MIWLTDWGKRMFSLSHTESLANFASLTFGLDGWGIAGRYYNKILQKLFWLHHFLTLICVRYKRSQKSVLVKILPLCWIVNGGQKEVVYISIRSIYDVTGTETSSRLVETIAVSVRSSSASALGRMSGEKGIKENKTLMYCMLQFWWDALWRQPIRDALRWSSEAWFCLDAHAQCQKTKWNLSRVSHWNVYLVLKHAGLNEDSATAQQSKQSTKHLKTCTSHYKILRKRPKSQFIRRICDLQLFQVIRNAKEPWATARFFNENGLQKTKPTHWQRF